MAGASIAAGVLAALVALPAGAVEPTPLFNPSGFGPVAAPVAAPVTAPAKPFIAPIAKVKYSARFADSGGNWSSGHHTGLDFVAPDGTPVLAAAGGVVIKTGWDGAYGKAVTIQHPDGLKTKYAHLSKIGVKKGQQVVVGQQIARSGSTGNTTGPHLHFEVIKGTKPVNPEKYL
jgi:murein DD-endopeptidase MepM/ murein hydrolase activator NlpD